MAGVGGIASTESRGWWFGRSEQLAPGLIVTGAIAAAAWWFGARVPLVGPAVFGLLAGLALGSINAPSAALQPGTDYTLKRLLRLAIVLFGASLSFAEIVNIGGGTLLVILAVVVLAISLTYVFGLWLRAPSRLVSLIGVGTAICGATAIITIGPIIEADEEETAFAVTTIFLFNMVAVIVYPLLGRLLALSSVAFGTWAGTAIHDTSSVLAAAYTFSDAAGKVGTVVKLTRTLMLVPLAFLFGVIHTYRLGRSDRGAATRVNFVKIFPWFILWFVLAAVLNTFGAFSASGVKFSAQVGKFLIVMVMVAVGLSANPRRMARMGLRPFFIGLFASLLIAAISIFLIRWVTD
ncbi:MAG: putative sulfate exporter family transporter [Armatimonadetes bacterium]|nr:putative sulfate exporter family transporter [Armatimonadota bacterium]